MLKYYGFCLYFDLEGMHIPQTSYLCDYYEGHGITEYGHTKDK